MPLELEAAPVKPLNSYRHKVSAFWVTMSLSSQNREQSKHFKERLENRQSEGEEIAERLPSIVIDRKSNAREKIFLSKKCAV
jgi:hypothetical protein